MPANLVTYKFYVDGYLFLPHYPASLAIENTKETDEQYYRKTLEGELTFVGSEFTYINNQAFDHEFLVLIETYIDGVQDTDQDWNGRFFKVDGEWDFDTQKVKTAVATKDQYTDFLSKYEKEYDLIKLATAKTPLSFDSRPLLQMYKPNDSLVACFVGGTYWEQAVTETKNANELAAYDFSLVKAETSVRLTEATTASVQAEGIYIQDGSRVKIVAEPTYEEFETYYKIAGSAHMVVLWESYVYVAEIDSWIPEDLAYYVTETGVSGYANAIYRSSTSAVNDLQAHRSGVTGSYTSATEQGEIYARWVCDSDTVNGNATTDIDLEDFVSDNRNYTKVISFSDAGGVTTVPISATAAGSTAPTEWGLKSDSTEYFVEPDNSEKYFPIGRNTWGEVSLWFFYTQEIYDVEESGRKQYTTNETMLISDVLDTLLTEMDTGTTHSSDLAYSEFLYDYLNPITNENLARLMITQKTNITAGNYDQPAQKSPITVKRILDALAQTLKLHWYIDDNGKLIIEHIKWFNNGGSYSVSPVVGTDLTSLYEPANRKTYSFATSKVSYEKQDVPERITFSWPDNVTEVFEGTGIDVLSNYTEDGTEETNQINYFTSDVDFMRLSPDEINPDGFALFYAHIPDANNWVLPYEEITFEGYTAYVQNAWLSMAYLLPTFHLYDAPASELEVNGESMTALTTKLIKTQTVKFPSLSWLDETKLVKTEIGNGRIEKNSLNLSSRTNEIELRYDAE